MRLQRQHSLKEISGYSRCSEKNLDSAIDNLKAAVKEEYKYVYAGLSWAEYWAAEGVQAAGDSSSSSELDTKGESDKGAFDVVTRATVNHGLHRGSYQCAATIEAENGKSYEVSYWTDSKKAVLTDGKRLHLTVEQSPKKTEQQRR